jgi:sugar phosphate isomerase/epimerase
MTTTREVLDLAREIGSPNLRLVLDVKSMSAEAPTPIRELIRLAAPDVAHFHANDANRRGPGFGAVDFAPIFRALDAVGYGGYVSVEVFDFTPSPEVIARESLRYLREASEASSGVP